MSDVDFYVSHSEATQSGKSRRLRSAWRWLNATDRPGRTWAVSFTLVIAVNLLAGPIIGLDRSAVEVVLASGAVATGVWLGTLVRHR